jgi:hypothetical protein
MICSLDSLTGYKDLAEDVLVEDVVNGNQHIRIFGATGVPRQL